MCLVDVRLLDSGENVSLDGILEKLRSLAKGKGAGAFSAFIGLVKGSVNGVVVDELVYTAINDVALRKLEEIARDICVKYSLDAIAIYHRLGTLKPGDTTIYIVALGVSRRNTNPAVSEALERVKKETPIFKLEKRSDGEYWVVGDGVRYRRVSRGS